MTENKLFKIPKNIRQIGQGDQVKRIYVEDYVLTYIKQLSTKSAGRSCYGILLGQFITIENIRDVFISGVVEIKKDSIEESLEFNANFWTGIYETIKEYFSDVEIVGWCVMKAGLPLEAAGDLERTHRDQFPGKDKVMLLYESIDKEEVFYMYEGNGLQKQQGYYVYYEKNEEMQNYMISQKEGGGNEIAFEDHTTREIRKVIEAKKPSRSKEASRGLLYAAGTLAAAVILVLGSYTLSSYDRMKDMEKTLNTISTSLGKQEPTDMTDGDEGQKTPVENVSGGVVEIEAETPMTAETMEPEITKAPDSPKPTDESINMNENSEEASAAIPEEYVVKKGDSLASISLQFYHTVSKMFEIKELNNIEDQNKILVGQKLILPK